MGIKLKERLRCSLVIGVLAFKDPRIFREDIFNVFETLIKFFEKVAEEHKPYMVRFGAINVETKEKTNLISLWAGPGLGANTWDRIQELVKENEFLKEELIKKTSE